MDEIDWAPLARLHDQYRAARDPRTRDVIEAVMTRVVEAIHRERPRTGTAATAIANHRRRERRRGELEALAAPLMAAANDPWPELDRSIARDRALRRLAPTTRALLDLLSEGHTYEEAGARLGKPVGTLKSQVSRARAALAA